RYQASTSCPSRAVPMPVSFRPTKSPSSSYGFHSPQSGSRLHVAPAGANAVKGGRINSRRVYTRTRSCGGTSHRANFSIEQLTRRGDRLGDRRLAAQARPGLQNPRHCMLHWLNLSAEADVLLAVARPPGNQNFQLPDQLFSGFFEFDWLRAHFVSPPLGLNH